MSFKHHKQMSESFLTAAFLSVSGGLQDAYTYIFRGKVFANAQTGNIVLLSQSISDKDFVRAIHYLVPLLFFALGIAIAVKEDSAQRGLVCSYEGRLGVSGQ